MMRSFLYLLTVLILPDGHQESQPSAPLTLAEHGTLWGMSSHSIVFYCTLVVCLLHCIICSLLADGCVSEESRSLGLYVASLGQKHVSVWRWEGLELIWGEEWIFFSCCSLSQDIWAYGRKSGHSQHHCGYDRSLFLCACVDLVSWVHSEGWINCRGLVQDQMA